MGFAFRVGTTGRLRGRRTRRRDQPNRGCIREPTGCTVPDGLRPDGDDRDRRGFVHRGSSSDTMYVGVDGCSAGWFAVRYDDEGYRDASLFDSIPALWSRWGEAADSILIDVPIGLRNASNAPRPPDTAAREELSPSRHASVFPTPVRAAVYVETYEAAKAIQEQKTDGSLGVQTWAIADDIKELDSFLLEREPAATDVIREAHPEVCFWALSGRTPTEYSKTAQPAAAFWERVEILEGIDPGIVSHVRDASADLDADVSNDDVIDAVALAVTASPLTGEPRSLPESGEPTDPRGLPMEMVYALPE